jgi:hypothetical protein
VVWVLAVVPLAVVRPAVRLAVAVAVIASSEARDERNLNSVSLCYHFLAPALGHALLLPHLLQVAYVAPSRAAMPPADANLETVWPKARPGDDGLFDVSSTQLCSFAPGGLRNDGTLKALRRLVAKHNRLTSFAGCAALRYLSDLDVSGNGFRFVDERAKVSELAQCLELQVLVCAANNISFVDMTLPSPAFAKLRVLDLSSNLLVDLPNVSSCHALECLHLHGNRLTTLSYFPDRVPTSLRELTLHDNAIADWYTLFFDLFSASELRSITIHDNPCSDLARRDGFKLPTLICAMHPQLEYLDGEEADHEAAGDVLNQLDAEASREDVLKILRQLSPLMPADASPDASPFRGAEPAGADDLVSAADFNSLSSKVSKMKETLAVLRIADMKTRVKAANTIKSFLKMALVRLGLFRKYNRAPKHVRRMREESRRRTALALALAPRLESRVGAVEVAVRQIWVDLAHFRGFLHAKRQFAARKIQAVYRGWVARCKYRGQREEFYRFANQYLPSIKRLQSFARMVIAKRRVRSLRRDSDRQRALEGEVSSLRDEVNELKKLVQLLLKQQQQQQPPPQSMQAVPSNGAPTRPLTAVQEESSVRSQPASKQAAVSLSPPRTVRTAGSTGAGMHSAVSNAVARPQPVHEVATSRTGVPATHSRRSESPTIASSSSPSPADGVSRMSTNLPPGSTGCTPMTSNPRPRKLQSEVRWRLCDTGRRHRRLLPR